MSEPRPINVYVEGREVHKIVVTNGSLNPEDLARLDELLQDAGLEIAEVASNGETTALQAESATVQEIVDALNREGMQLRVDGAPPTGEPLQPGQTVTGAQNQKGGLSL